MLSRIPARKVAQSATHPQSHMAKKESRVDTEQDSTRWLAAANS